MVAMFESCENTVTLQEWRIYSLDTTHTQDIRRQLLSIKILNSTIMLKYIIFIMTNAAIIQHAM